MPTGHVFMALSLDGFVARPDHQIDWLTKQETGDEDLGYDAFIEPIDGLVMGRGSYENVLTFGDWPYTKPVVVMSKTLEESHIPAELKDKVRLTRLDPPELMESLQSQGWSRVYVDGGKIVQSFIRCGLIDDLVLTTIPILIGDGLRLFGDIEKDIDLQMVDSKFFTCGLVQTHYRIVRQ